MRRDIPFVSSVLHPTDFSDASGRAFAHALAISLVRQTVLSILHVGGESEEDIHWSKFPQVRKTLERWNLLEPGSGRSAVADQLNVDVCKIAIPGRDPVREATRLLEHQPHDLVVLATEGSPSSGEDWLHRSDAEGIARGSGAMTLFVPSATSRGIVSLEDGDINLESVLVPIDPSIDFSAAIELARRAADVLGDGEVSITLLHVGERLPAIPALPDGDGWTWDVALRQGEVARVVLDEADELDADLIIMATNGRDSLRQALAGSTTERVLRKAPCPVLAVPEKRF